MRNCNKNCTTFYVAITGCVVASHTFAVYLSINLLALCTDSGPKLLVITVYFMEASVQAVVAAVSTLTKGNYGILTSTDAKLQESRWLRSVYI